MDFEHGFQFIRELGVTASGKAFSLEALTAINWAHRVGALVTLLYLGALAMALLRTEGCKAYAWALLLLLLTQVSLGIGTAMLGLPLVLAIAHNAGAAALLMLITAINFVLARATCHAARG
jgi:cytochrome c oxidase assembly protein subunit 15